MLLNHMTIKWENFIEKEQENIVKEATLQEKSSIVGRVGMILLSCGSSAWRVRDAMNNICESLGIVCSADIGLLSITYNCMDQNDSITQVFTLKSTGVNTAKLMKIENFVNDFHYHYLEKSIKEIHKQLQEIEQTKELYSVMQASLGAAAACAAFAFLLGGGPVEMICTFLGAGTGQFTRKSLRHYKKLSLLLCTVLGVVVSSLTYAGVITLAEYCLQLGTKHEAGYVCAMLFVIPGYPFITSGIDFAKSDMRSGLERLMYAVMMVVVSTMVAWIVALVIHFQPGELTKMEIPFVLNLVLQGVTSFVGVFGFSILFNSPIRMAVTAGMIGAIANVFRLQLVEMTSIPAAAAAFLGAFLAGIITTMVRRKVNYPRTTLTIPAIVVMVPGLFLYHAIYNIGNMNLETGVLFLNKAIFIIIALPLGLIFARMLSEERFRRCI